MSFIIFLRFDNIKNIDPEERCFCQKCGELLAITQKGLHEDHGEFLEENINDIKLSHPSQVLIIEYYMSRVLYYVL